MQKVTRHIYFFQELLNYVLPRWKSPSVRPKRNLLIAITLFSLATFTFDFSNESNDKVGQLGKKVYRGDIFPVFRCTFIFSWKIQSVRVFRISSDVNNQLWQQPTYLSHICEKGIVNSNSTKIFKINLLPCGIIFNSIQQSRHQWMGL